MDWNSGTIEFWIRPSATDADNGQEIAPGANYNLTNSNIIWDGDSVNTRGFIIGLSGGAVCFGVNAASERTIQGTTDLRDGQWHHVAVYRNSGSGLMEIFVDGAREATFSGPTGLITYDGDSPATDQYHYLCKEKLNATFGCDCDMSEIRVSSNQRYSGATYTVPTAAFTTDANTIGLYHFDENSGTTLGDSSGNNFDGELLQSPTWSTADPFP